MVLYDMCQKSSVNYLTISPAVSQSGAFFARKSQSLKTFCPFIKTCKEALHHRKRFAI